MKILIIITIGISLLMFYFALGIYLNIGLNSKYQAVSQEDIDYAFSFSKYLLAYIILVLVVMISALINSRKVNSKNLA